MSRLEISQNKLERLTIEKNNLSKKISDDRGKIPLGQPVIRGRRDIYKDTKNDHKKLFKLMDEIEIQEDRVEMLGKVEEFKAKNELLQDVHVVGKTGHATVGAKTSVNNLNYFRNQLAELEKANEEAKAYNKTKPKHRKETFGSNITALKNKIRTLEQMKDKADNQLISAKAQQLIDDGLVNQWKKKPIYYFVKGLRKVALELNSDGEFEVSKKYPAHSEEDKVFINKLLGTSNTEELI